MLLGKRLRPPMNRTTSMTEFPSDLVAPGATQPANQERTHRHQRERQRPVGVSDDDWLEALYGATPPAALGATQPANQERTHRHQRERQRPVGVPDDDWLEARYGATPPPRGGAKRSSGNFAATETAAFLKACGLCQRRLGSGKDIFMYRGHIAFCSLECRQQQINQDERKEKCSTTSQATAESSNNGETMASA